MGDREPASPAIQEIADRHVLEILRAAARRAPGNLEALSELGDLLTRHGHLQEGLEVDLRLARLLPGDPTVHYTLACSYALLHRREEAFRELQAAISRGYKDADHMRRDRDLDPLRLDPRFEEFLKEIEQP